MAEDEKKSSSSSPFSNPVFKRISRKNGEINKMKDQELRKLAKVLQVNANGSTEVLKKRLKTHYKTVYMKEAQVASCGSYYPYYIVIDFEATCEEISTRTEFQHEIIEFPAVLLNSETMEVEDIFHEYVKPTVNNLLSDYCKALTGITQEQVDAASSFPQVLHRFEEWLYNHNVIGQSALVTDGPWDMARFLYTQVKLSHLTYPKYAEQWVNVKKVFANFYKQKTPTLNFMLNKLNFQFKGRNHSGIDDAKNITQVLIQLLKDGACVRVNQRIDLCFFQSPHIPPICDIVKTVEVDNILLFGEFHKMNNNGCEKKCTSKLDREVENENCMLQTCPESTTLNDA